MQKKKFNFPLLNSNLSPEILLRVIFLLYSNGKQVYFSIHDIFHNDIIKMNNCVLKPSVAFMSEMGGWVYKYTYNRKTSIQIS